jgi:hypothetical protein
MTGSTITSTVGAGITVGTANYLSPLTITAAGAVVPGAPSGTGVYAPAGPNTVTVFNQGFITGGGGGEFGSDVGGDAVDFMAAASLANSGTIVGGTAGADGNPADTGGVGVNLAAGGSIGNFGTISGGTGGEYAGGKLIPGHGGVGGDGVDIAGGTLTNAAAIYGGSGGVGGNSLAKGFGGDGGYGVHLTGGSLTNSGTITGGAGGLNGGDFAGAGIVVGTGAVATNNATIVGGQGGNAGFSRYGGAGYAGAGGAGAIVQGGVLIDTGIITGGNGGVVGQAGAGGDGVLVEGGTLVAEGTISGGFSGGGNSPFDAVFFAGPAVGTLVVDPSAVFNGTVNGYGHGILELGAGAAPTTLAGLGSQFIGFNLISIVSDADWTVTGSFGAIGGPAVTVAANSTLTVSGGAITGGGGLYGAIGRPGGTGSSGIILSANDTLTNHDTVTGGSGGSAAGSGSANTDIGGSGGVGLKVAAGDSVTNDGTISGGNGGNDRATSNGGAGGDAVDMSGGILTNTGRIIGGSGGTQVDDTSLSGYAGDGAESGIGVSLTAGATVVNQGTIAAGNQIDGENGVAAYLNASSLINSGLLLAGYRADGAELVNGATLSNTGTIAGGMGLGNGIVNNAFPEPFGNGVVLTSGSALTNDGTIIAGLGGAGVLLSDSSLINDLLITATDYGDGVSLVAGSSMTNNGTITGGGGSFYDRLSVRERLFGSGAVGAGVALAATTTATNDGTITGGFDADGAYVAAGATLTNHGSIGSQYGYGVHLTTGAELVNSGLIAGSRAGGGYMSGGTLVNSGTVAAGLYASGVFLNGGTLITSGTVVGRASFQITEPPRQGPNQFYPGGTYTVPGFAAVQFGSVAATLVVDPGAVFLDGISATPTVSDTLELGTGPFAGTLTGLGSSITGFGTIAFDQGANWFLGGDTVGLNGTIEGFAPGDTIEMTGITVTGTSYAGDVLTLTDTTGVASLTLPGPFTTSDFQVTNVAGGADITLAPICYLPGTLIATPEGEIEVERLTAGGLVLTLSGAARRIVWVGTGRVLATRGRRNAATPVIVRKGALGDNVPHTDLRVTKAHSFYLDEVLVPVEFLVNHRTILWDDHAQEVTIYHIELETHDVLLANGAPAESYRDDGNRWLFQNANDGWDRPPAEPCAPVLTGGAVVDAIWQRLLDRAPPRRGVPLTDDPDLHLVVDGRRLDATERTGDVWVFRVAAWVSALHIVSRAAAPDELGLARDPRVLGVAIHRIVVRKGTRFQVVKAGDERLADGFHAFEADSGVRWTNGDAVVPASLLVGFSGSFEVVLHVGATTRYLADGAVERVA